MEYYEILKNCQQAIFEREKDKALEFYDLDGSYSIKQLEEYKDGMIKKL